MSLEFSSLIEKVVRRAIREQMSLGLSEGGMRRLDIERGNRDGRDYCWGYWDSASSCLRPEFRSCLTGYLRSIGVRKVTYKKDVNLQLILEIDAGVADFRIKTGLESAAGKSLVCAIAALSEEQIKQPVSLRVRPGDDEKVVLASIYSQKRYVKGQAWPEDQGTLRQVCRQAFRYLNVLKFDEGGKVIRDSNE